MAAFEILVLSAVSLLAFLLSLAISYGIAWLIKQLRHQSMPLPGAVLRIRCSGSLHRVKFLGATPEGWSFTPPLDEGVPIPIRVGETLLVEAPCPGGAVRFRSQLVWRSANPLMMVMQAPRDCKPVDRRTSKRLTPVGELTVALEGARSALVDLGEHGARVLTDAQIGRGERVHLSFFWSEQPLAAHVLDIATPDRTDFKREVRLVFEEPTHLDALKKQFAPAG